ncbi:hypothetical protein [Lentilitoribacter sp. EG35]|uniref:hypothetical protein n=1 Tax=Lentilitoribacter sp. EG35 TaxID=3234192 RepID=UPI003460A15B
MTSANQQKRPAPLSIRLTGRERKKLEKLAGEKSLNKYIKDQIFTTPSKLPDSEIMDRYEMLARILSILGENDVFGNLDRVVKAIDRGELELNDQQQEQIGAACLLVLEIRNDLIKALGLKPPPIFEERDN